MTPKKGPGSARNNSDASLLGVLFNKQKASVASWGSPATGQELMKMEGGGAAAVPRPGTSVSQHKASIFSWTSSTCSSSAENNNDVLAHISGGGGSVDEAAFDELMAQKRSKVNSSGEMMENAIAGIGGESIQKPILMMERSGIIAGRGGGGGGDDQQ